jgi:hypothetical protein
MINIHSIKKNNSIYKYICLPLLQYNYNKELKKIIIIFFFYQNIFSFQRSVCFDCDNIFLKKIITCFALN